MPGGEAAIREPWRMACAWLLEIGRDVPPEWEQVAQLARTGLASPLTTSMGRLFDAVAALCGIRDTVTYEGQAAIELEARRRRRTHERAAYRGSPGCSGCSACMLDARPTVAAVVDDVARGVDVALVSARFHNAVARATAAALRTSRSSSSPAASSRTRCCSSARSSCCRARSSPRRLPVNDGGIAYGQAAIAARRAQSRTP